MKVIDAVEHLRVSVLDDKGGLGVNWKTLSSTDVDAIQLRWSNEELTYFIKCAQELACRAASILKTTITIPLVVGQKSYSLDPKILKIKNAYLTSNGKLLNPVDFDDLVPISGWGTVSGTPSYYVKDFTTNSILIHPIPNAADTLTLVVYRLPVNDPVWDTAATTDLEVPEKDQMNLLDYAAYLAYRKEDPNTSDLSRATYFLSQFNEYFSSTSAYIEGRKQRTTPRPIAYGGL